MASNNGSNKAPKHTGQDVELTPDGLVLVIIMPFATPIIILLLRFAFGLGWILSIVIGIIAFFISVAAAPTKKKSAHTTTDHTQANKHAKQVSRTHSPPPILAQHAWGSYDSISMEEAHHNAAIARATNSIDLHFAYLGMIEFTYRNRSTHLERCIEFCKEDIDLFPLFEREYLRKYPTKSGRIEVRIPSFEKLAIIYGNQGKFEDAIKVCELALSYGLQDSTKGGFEGRIERLKRKALPSKPKPKKASTAQAEEKKPPAPVVVSVDKVLLDKIRTEALDTQNKLAVECDKAPLKPPAESKKDETTQVMPSGMGGFVQLLTQLELDAMLVILQAGDINQFSIENGIFLDVLIDGINEKSYDAIGDIIIDSDSMDIYPDYENDIRTSLISSHN